MLSNGIEIEYRATALAGQWQVILNLAMPSCDGYAGRFVEADGSVPGGFGQPLAIEPLTSLRLEDGVLGGAIALSVQPPARLSSQPHKTVSQSEAGFEKIMQAVEITLSWPLSDQSATGQQFRINLQTSSLPPSPLPLK